MNKYFFDSSQQSFLHNTNWNIGIGVSNSQAYASLIIRKKNCSVIIYKDKPNGHGYR